MGRVPGAVSYFLGLTTATHSRTFIGDFWRVSTVKLQVSHLFAVVVFRCYGERPPQHTVSQEVAYMRRGILSSSIVAAMSMAAALGGPGMAGAQNRESGSTSWAVPRTPDGKPDLQGVWNFSSATALERPAEFAGREFLSDEDVAGVEQRAAERRRVQRSDDNLYNTPPWWLDSGTRVVNTRRSSLIIDPPDGRFPAMTAAGVKRIADLTAARSALHGPESLSSWERCITRGFPAVMIPSVQNNNLRILQTPGYVSIVTEMIHEARIIPTDGRPHVSENLRQWTGNSRGRWEGDTLVLETSRFSDQADFFAPPNYRFLGAGTQLRLIERLHRIDAQTIEYQLTIEDPATWVRPWTIAFPLVKTDGLIYEYACHEGNYNMANMLRSRVR
jgi:hypothetical protein